MRLEATKDLGPIRAAAKARVDAAAEAFRHRYITPGSGQAMTYQKKYEEALAFLANPDIDPALVPHVYAEVGITAPTPHGVATVFRDMHDLWASLSPHVDRARLGAKKAIDLAATPAAIEAAATVDWSPFSPDP